MGAVEGGSRELTRKQRREDARARRRAAEAVEAAHARRTRQIQLGLVAAIAGVVVVTVAVLLANGGGSKAEIPVSRATTSPPTTVTEVTSLLNGIPQNANALGSLKAPVALQYFGDLECPFCRAFTLGALPTLVGKYVRTGKLKIEYHNLETATGEPETFRTQQVAALAAGQQQKLWFYIELFYHEQQPEGSGYVTESYLQGLAKQVPGLDLASWTAARNDPAFTDAITTDAQTASNAGFTSTPSFLIGRTGGPPRHLEPASLTDPSSFEAAIEALLKAGR
jgi:protein-disulfide isomerase